MDGPVYSDPLLRFPWQRRRENGEGCVQRASEGEAPLPVSRTLNSPPPLTARTNTGPLFFPPLTRRTFSVDIRRRTAAKEPRLHTDGTRAPSNGGGGMPGGYSEPVGPGGGACGRHRHRGLRNLKEMGLFFPSLCLS